MLTAGTVVDRYEVLGLLGEGGMSRVYRVRHRRLGSEHVLKVLALPGEAQQARLLREGQVQAALRHPNVVEVTDIIDVAGSPGLVMPRIDGPSLDRVLAAGRLSRPLVNALVPGICAGLAAAHAAGVVHRDLKPANVLIQLHGGRVVPKVADFGLVKHLHRDVTDAQTASQATMGTPLYMAPEQIRGTRDVDQRADVWALGALLYELATGTRAFDGESTFAIFEAVIAHRWRPTEAVDPTLPPAWIEAIGACLTGLEERAGSVAEVFATWSGGEPLDAHVPVPCPPETLRQWRSLAIPLAAPVSATWVDGSPPSLTPPTGTTVIVPHHLPGERDSFVGRQADLQGLADRLHQGARLITVLGFGGTGKTRLVTHFGWTRRLGYPGGVWFCDLSDARSEAGIAQAVARAFDVPLATEAPIAQLGHSIRGKGRCLILLDNAEQVTSAAADVVSRWLDHAEEATFVVTSREVLGLPGEELLPLDVLPQDDAVALFVVRAAQAGRDVVADDEAPIIALVQLLDGLPLAIELAAARSRVMSPATLLQRMSERFRLLASTGSRPPRQATLRGALDWSWGLLAAQEQRALAQLSVFEGGFTLEAAESVLSLDGLWAADAVPALVDKSLVRASKEGRFDLLMSVQAYAAEQLEGGSEAAATRARHGATFATFGADDAVDALEGPEGVGLRRALAAERANLTVATQRAVARGDAAAAVALARAAWEVLSLTGPFSEAVDLLRAVVAMDGLGPWERGRAGCLLGITLRLMGRRPEASDLLAQAATDAVDAGDPRTESTACGELGILKGAQGHLDEAHALLASALHVARAVGHRGLECRWLGNQGSLHYQQGQMTEARASFEQALALSRAVGDRAQERRWLGNMGTLHKQQGRVTEARAHYEQVLTMSREVGDRRSESFVLGTLGNVHLAQGRMTAAQAHLALALVRAREVGDGLLECSWLGNLGNVTHEQGRSAEARVHFEQALALARELGDRRLESTWLGALGRVHEAQGHLDDAQAHYTEAWSVACAIGDHRQQGVWLGAKGALHAARGHATQARADVDAATAQLRIVGDAFELGKLLCHRARLDHAEGRDADATLREVEALVAAAGAGPDSELGRALVEARAATAKDPR